MHYFWGGGGSKSFSKYFFRDSFLLLHVVVDYTSSFCLACCYVQISQSVDLFHCWLICGIFSFLAIAKIVLLWTFLYIPLMSLLNSLMRFLWEYTQELYTYVHVQHFLKWSRCFCTQQCLSISSHYHHHLVLFIF